MASLGLYGLVTINVSGRNKEFSIRKTLGARVSNIAISLARQYILVFVIALALGLPIGFVVTDSIFNSVYYYAMPMNYSFSIFSIAMLILILLAVIGIQLKRLSRTNPIEGLRVE